MRIKTILVACLAALSSSLFGQLSGTYTIGGVVPNYISIEAAVADLIEDGVSGPVIFDIRSGTYEEQLTIPAITGASETNTILFRSETLNYDDVIVEHDAISDAGSQHTTLTLDGATNVQFMYLTFGVIADEWEYIVVAEGSTNILFENCRFDGSDQCESPDFRESINANSPSNDSNWVLRNNVFDGNCMAIEMAYGNNWLIEGNEFVNIGQYGIFTGYSDGIDFVGNYTTTPCVFYTSENVNFTFEYNYWRGAVVFDGNTGTEENPTLMANNFLINGGWCMEIFAANHLQLYQNSLKGGSGCIYGTITEGPDMKNNILYSSGPLFNLSSTFEFVDSDYNCLYSEDDVIAVVNGDELPSLADWQGYLGLDQNSFVAGPGFVSDLDLHVCNPALDQTGLPLDEIAFDYDGQPRPIGNNDIGADEFSQDFCECTLEATAQVISDYNGADISCWGAIDGAFEINIVGANGNVVYGCGIDQESPVFEGYGAGTYYCTVTDETCSVDVEITLTEPEKLELILEEFLDPPCNDPYGGWVQYTAIGGTPEYSWFGSDDIDENGYMGDLYFDGWVTVIDANECTVFDEFWLQPVLENNIEVMGFVGDSIVCPGDSIQLYCKDTGGPPWDPENPCDWIGYEPGVFLDDTPFETTTYVLHVTSASGCVDTLEYTAIVLPEPDVSFEQDTILVCQDQEVVTLPAGYPTGGYYDGLAVTEDEMSLVFLSPGYNPFYYTYEDSLGCSATAQGQVNILELPDVSIDDFPDFVVCLGDPAIDLPSGSPAGGTYAGDGIVGGQFDPTEAGVGNFEITYWYTDEYGCSSFSSTNIGVELCENVNENDLSILHVYPNPSSGDVTITLDLPGVVQVISSSGQLVQQWNITNVNSTINLSLASGMYFVNVVSENQTDQVKLIVR